MAFTQPCFIRKNTPELRKKLEELGYEPNGCECFWEDDNRYIITTIGEGYGYYTLCIKNCFLLENELFIDCGTNEELFLALAALRDDTDKWQLFIFDGIDVPDYFLQKGDMWICSLDKHLVKNCHKATVEEIIEHFK